MESLTDSLFEWPPRNGYGEVNAQRPTLIRQIREGTDSPGLEAMSDNSVALDHPFHKTQ
jgi:hypothetical protein